MTDAEVPLRDRLKTAFESELTIPSGTEPHLAAAMGDVLGRTGNFIRAQLAYSLCMAYGLGDTRALQLAVALEYFHTASLIFDDLPSMDDATHRRGAVCVHLMYGEGTSVLAALALINHAYALLWRAVSDAVPEDRTAALAYVERYLGLGGVLNGQSYDLQYAATPTAERSAQKVAMGKTVGLIRLSIVLPATLAGALPLTVHLLDRLAVYWGLAYQVIDDLKDVLHGPERTGKTTARDTALDRPNMVLALGPEVTVKKLEKLIQYGGRVVDRVQREEPRLACLAAPRARLEHEARGILLEMAGVAAG